MFDGGDAMTTAAGGGNRAAGTGRSGSGAGAPQSARGGVVIILREDARIPPGHVAEACGGKLRERAGLEALRRMARVRVLSSAESAVALPR